MPTPGGTLEHLLRRHPAERRVAHALDVRRPEDLIHVWLGDAYHRIECAFPGDEATVHVPHGLLQNLDATEVVLAVFTERVGRVTTGPWDVDWRARNVEVLGPVYLDDRTP